MRINDSIIRDTDTAGAEPAAADNVKAKPSKPVVINGRKSKSTGKGATGNQQAKSGRSGDTKSETVLKKLRSTKGATIAMLVEATGWQAHSVRSFLSATVRKKLGLSLVSEIGKDGIRRYRIDDHA